MGYFTYNGKSIYYSELGSGRPLLLHGNTVSPNMYADIAERFAAQREVILLDFLGH